VGGNSLLYNAGSQIAQRHLSIAGRAMNQSIRRISSGYRVETAADDAAGIAIATTSRAAIRSYEMASRNAEDAIGLMQTTEGSLLSIVDITIRMRELAVQGASDTITDKERAYLDTEFQSNANEIDRIFRSAEYNGISLLDGAADYDPNGFKFLVGLDPGPSNALKLNLDFSGVFAALNSGSADLTSQGNSQLNIDTMDEIIDIIQPERVKLGSMINRLTIAHDNLAVTTENAKDSLSTRIDTDIAAESSKFIRNKVLVQASIAMIAQANAHPSMLLKLLP
jgi:flagellin